MSRQLRSRVSKVAYDGDDDEHIRSSLTPPARNMVRASDADAAPTSSTLLGGGLKSSKFETWPLPNLRRNERVAFQSNRQEHIALYPKMDDETDNGHNAPIQVVAPHELASEEPSVLTSQNQALQRRRSQALPSQQRHVAESPDDASAASFASLASVSVLRFNRIEDSNECDESQGTWEQSQAPYMTTIAEDTLKSPHDSLELYEPPGEAGMARMGNQLDPSEFLFPGSRECDEQNDHNDEDLIEPIMKEITIQSPHQSSRNLIDDKSSRNRSKHQTRQQRPMKILFLSAAGRHQASADALADQFRQLYPVSTCHMLDVWESRTNARTFDSLPSRDACERTRNNTRQQRWVRRFSKVKPIAILVDQFSKFASLDRIRQRIAECNPDAVVSVHPTMNSVPFLAVQKIGNARGVHIPFFTVVDEVSKAPSSWFQRNVDKAYVFSDDIRLQAKRKGHLPDENIVITGIPLAAEFDVHADAMGNRETPQAKTYQQSIRKQLGLEPDKTVVVVMGECVDKDDLLATVDQLYMKFSSKGLAVTVCVISGGDDSLRKELAAIEWGQVAPVTEPSANRRSFFRSPFNQSEAQSLGKATSSDTSESSGKGEVTVVALGRVPRIVEYMVAADILMTSADSRIIAEAATVGLPITLTSILPGQEEEDAEFVITSGYGRLEKAPHEAAKEVACWIEKPALLETMSRAAYRTARPHAAADIVLDIGTITQTWLKLNSPAVGMGGNDEVEVQ